MPQIQQVCKADKCVYGADKIWRQLKRQNVDLPQTVRVDVPRGAAD